MHESLEERYRKLYEQHGKALEADHWGEYVAVSPDGRSVLGKDGEARCGGARTKLMRW